MSQQNDEPIMTPLPTAVHAPIIAKLKVAVIGRPNVGKSTLFNQLTGTRKAVVKDQPGVTRDVHRGVAEWRSVSFFIYDTAGVSQGGDKAWSSEIRKKALEAAQAADKIILVLDGKYGLNPEDKDLSQFVMRLNKPFIAVVNKVDNPTKNDMTLSEFFELGFETMIAASFEHKFGTDELLDWVVEGQTPQPEEEEESKTIRLAVVGKPNAGKSTLVNSILGEERVVVSPVAGTTIDSIEVPFIRNNQEFVLVDTAGLRRHAKRLDHVEMVSAYKAEESVIEADILLVVVDGLLGPSVQDARIVEMAFKHHRAVILVVNKIDLAERQIPKFREKLRQHVEDTFHFYRDIPVEYISAKTKRGVDGLFTKIEAVWQQLNKKISTRDINDFFFQVIRQAPSPSWRGNDIKFYYITQTKQRPPSFMAFVNEPRGITNSYKRFIIGQIKKNYNLVGIPIRIYPKKTRSGTSKSQNTHYGDKKNL
ncbi:MAG: ribosome biogenesis GTPase Der [Oligoflexia bacterium]|nr:ribosome biogenesis GTPase Der [Oligoflexia bacterium]